MFSKLRNTMVCIATCTAVSGTAFAQQTLQPVQLNAFLAARLGPVLDVRMAGDCDASIRLARSSVKIPYDGHGMSGDARAMVDEEFMQRVLKSASLANAKKARATLLVVCCAGGRSEDAAGVLRRHGFKTATLSGGVASQSMPRHLLRAK